MIKSILGIITIVMMLLHILGVAVLALPVFILCGVTCLTYVFDEEPGPVWPAVIWGFNTAIWLAIFLTTLPA